MRRTGPCCLVALIPFVLGVFLFLLPIIMIMIAVSGSQSNHANEEIKTNKTCGTTPIKVSEKVHKWMAAAAESSGLPEGWLTAIADRESDFDPEQYTPDENGGTWGLFQINREEWGGVYPGASKKGTGTPPGITDPMTHAKYGGIYFKNRLETVQKLKEKNPDKPFAALSDLDALVIAHNAGEGNLVKYPKLPSITKDYLKEIQRNFTAEACTPTGTPTPTPGGNGLSGVDDYKEWWQSKGSLTSGYDPQGFAWAQCTSYSAFAVRKYTSYTNFSNSWKGLHFGNAAEWHIAAKKAGIRVDKTPAVGAVAQRLNGTWGHVAFVVAVNEDGTFVINEYNHVVRRGFSTRTARLGEGSHDFAQFLHFEEPSTS